MRTRSHPLLAAVLAVTASAAHAADLRLTGATVLDGTGGAPRRGLSLLVRDGRLARIAPDVGAAEGETIDLGGRFVLPGLIDAHVHVDSPEAALKALHSGVTTARLLGDGGLQGPGLRDLIRAGHVPGPELQVSGPHVRTRLGSAFFMAFPQFGRLMEGGLRGPETVAEVVRELLQRGVDVIKVSASERAGLAGTDPRKPELTEDEIRAAVTEAASRGKFVAAHSHSRAGCAAAVRAGVRSLEHGTYADDATLDMMKARGTFLVPTLAAMSPLADPSGQGADAVTLQIRTHHMAPVVCAMVRRARSRGVVIVASTDGSYADGDETGEMRVPHDLERMLGCGLTPAEAVAAATVNGARLLGIEGRTGRVAEGLEADLIVVDRNPLDDVTALFEPLLVLTDGRVALNRLD
jgi:imidazolonepropionase-like amidohydrolase